MNGLYLPYILRDVFDLFYFLINVMKYYIIFALNQKNNIPKDIQKQSFNLENKVHIRFGLKNEPFFADTDDYARVALPTGQDETGHPDSSDVESVVEDDQGFAF